MRNKLRNGISMELEGSIQHLAIAFKVYFTRYVCIQETAMEWVNDAIIALVVTAEVTGVIAIGAVVIVWHNLLNSF